MCANTHMHWCTYLPSLHWPEISADLKNCSKITEIQQAASRKLKVSKMVYNLLAHIFFRLWLV